MNTTETKRREKEKENGDFRKANKEIQIARKIER
jgi:hypothetical protein